MTFIPLFIDFRGKGVVVFGGGAVGTRRALEFARAGARVTVVAERFSQELEVAARAGEVELVRASLRPGDDLSRLLRGRTLAVIATSDPTLNSYLASSASSAGLLVNNATEAAEGDVVFPFRAEPLPGLHIAVTTMGASGVAARWARDRASACLSSDRELMTLLEVMSAFKRELKTKVKDARTRVSLYFKVESDLTFRDLVSRGDLEGALRRALDIAGLPY
ncbi:MAG: precorrin-2 dehydrogenase/sirohydrochlorin ferrochelatase family protein [Acidilobus sp.]